MLYLHKQAYLSKVDREPEYQHLIAELDRRSAGKDERIQTMRGFWEQRLGVKDLTRMPGYEPLGEYQLAFRAPGKTAGYRHQYRFDLSDQELEKQMKGYGLHHALTNGEDLSSFVAAVLGNNGALVSTVEKMRAGIPVAGMSPAADMGTGIGLADAGNEARQCQAAFHGEFRHPENAGDFFNDLDFVIQFFERLEFLHFVRLEASGVFKD